MTGGWLEYIEAGWGPDETVAAEYEVPEACGGAGSDAGAGGKPAITGGGAEAGPIPGPIALISWLQFRN
jgi:hypothetical protein